MDEIFDDFLSELISAKVTQIKQCELYKVH